MIYDVVHRWAEDVPDLRPTLTSIATVGAAEQVDQWGWPVSYVLDRDPLTFLHEASGTVRFPSLSPLALRSILACRVVARYEGRSGGPDDTTVDARFHDGADSYVWDDAAWRIAAADEWGTIDELEAHASEWDPTLPVGVELRLRTLDGHVSPRVYGVLVLWRVAFGARSGRHSRPDSWEDDALTRTFVEWLRALTYHRAVERKVLAGATAVDLTDLGGYQVADVEAAYWIDLDPDLRTPVAGAFDGEAFVLEDAREIDGMLHVDTQCAVHAVYMPDGDYVSARVPIVALTEVAKERRRRRGRVVVRTPDGALGVERPAVASVTLTARIDAPDPKDCAAVEAAIRDAIEPADVLPVTSVGTGQPVFIGASAEPARQGSMRGALPSRTMAMSLRFGEWSRREAVPVPVVSDEPGVVFSGVAFEVTAPVTASP